MHIYTHIYTYCQADPMRSSGQRAIQRARRTYLSSVGGVGIAGGGGEIGGGGGGDGTGIGWWQNHTRMLLKLGE